MSPLCLSLSVLEDLAVIYPCFTEAPGVFSKPALDSECVGCPPRTGSCGLRPHLHSLGSTWPVHILSFLSVRHIWEGHRITKHTRFASDKLGSSTHIQGMSTASEKRKRWYLGRLCDIIPL